MKVDFSTLGSLVDADKISTYDWCSYVLDKLCKQVVRYNTKKDTKYISGCLVVLQLVYFHRYKWQGVSSRTALPLIQHWTADDIKERIMEETKAGKFGDGVWDLETYPITNRQREQNTQPRGRKGEKEEKESEKKDRKIEFLLPQEEMTDDEIKTEAEDEISEMYMILKRNISVITEAHYQRLDQLKSLLIKQQEQQEHGDSSQTESQRYWSNPDVLRDVDEIIDKFSKLSKISTSMRAMPGTFRTLRNPGVPDIREINWQLLSQSQKSSGHNEQVDNRTEDEKPATCFADYDEQESNDDGSPLCNTPDGHLDAVIQEIVESTTGRKRMEEKSTGEGVEWPTFDKVEFVSEMMKKNRSLFTETLDLKEQAIADYCFFSHATMDLRYKSQYMFYPLQYTFGHSQYMFESQYMFYLLQYTFGYSQYMF